jgi:hypothetical protein
VTAPAVTLERHLAEVRTGGCTCPHSWKALGILYGISFGKGWVRLDDAEDCPVHGRPRTHRAG